MNPSSEPTPPVRRREGSKGGGFPANLRTRFYATAVVALVEISGGLKEQVGATKVGDLRENGS